MGVSPKVRVAVLYGGRSSEHEVSIQSAANVIKFLDRTRYDIIPIGIDKTGKWLIGQEVFNQSLTNQTVRALPSDTWFTPEWVSKPFAQQEITALFKTSKLPDIDVIFPCVHGVLCEDGTLQGLLELANMPYVGCGVLASAIGMDKDIAKRLAKLSGIPVAPYFVIKRPQWEANKQEIAVKVAKLTYPVFVKPANSGSSVGISKVISSADLSTALDFAFSFDDKVVVEKGLDAQELELAVLESLDDYAEPIASIVGEIQPTKGFYSYSAKYLDDHGAKLLIPATITAAVAASAQDLARQLFSILECNGMARVDLFLERNTRRLYFNEINTLPGFTKISMYPKLMEASGVSYANLLTHLIELAFKRFKVKSKLCRIYTTTTAETV